MNFSLLRFISPKARKFIKTNPVASRYLVDGLIVATASNIAASNNNLFALRLGASNFQLSLIHFLPQMLTFLVLIPGGLFMDTLHNKRRTVIITMIICMFGYLLCGLSPFAGNYSIQFFLVSLSLTAGSMALYNLAWQSFFPNVVDLSKHNYVLTLRTRVSLPVGVVMPLVIGVILASIKTINGKIAAQQIFYLIGISLFLSAVLNFRRFRKFHQPVPNTISLSEMKKAGKSLFKNKPFLTLASVTLFFYLTWHSDWTLFFIGQVTYLGMNEFQLGIMVTSVAAVQMLTLKFWSRINERYGVVFPFVFGILGLSLCPVIMIAAVSMSASINQVFFMVAFALAHFPMCVIGLNLFQCLLQVVDEKHRSFYLSIFTCLVCLSNAIMPVAGVALYSFMGNDINSLRYTLGIIFILRLIAAGVWLLRWRMQKKEEA
jgi:MFS family permease